MKSKLKGNNIVVIIIALLCIAIMVMPTIISSAYSVLVADDFSAGSMFGKGYTGIKYLKYYYEGWQGTYTGLILIPLLSPIAHGGILSLRIIAIIVSTLVYVSYAYLVDSIVVSINECSNLWMRVGAIIFSLYMLTSFMSYFEVYYWFTGIAVYTVPMIAGMVGLALFFFNKNGSIWKYVVSGVLGIIASGGALAIPGFCCYFLFITLIYKILKEKRISLSQVIVFIIWVVGALINAAAPGNFARHSVVDSTGVHPLQGLMLSIKLLLGRLLWFTESTSLVAGLLLFLACAVVLLPSQKKISLSYIWASILLFLMPIVTIFPVALGQGEITPNRVLFVFDIAIYLVIINTVICISYFIKNYIIEKEQCKMFSAIIAIVAVAIALTDSFNYQNTVFYQVTSQLINGEYQEYYRNMLRLYDTFDKTEEGTGVVLSSSDLPNDISNFKNFYLDPSPEDWVNIDISNYYGFESITLIEE